MSLSAAKRTLLVMLLDVPLTSDRFSMDDGVVGIERGGVSYDLEGGSMCADCVTDLH